MCKWIIIWWNSKICWWWCFVKYRETQCNIYENGINSTWFLYTIIKTYFQLNMNCIQNWNTMKNVNIHSYSKDTQTAVFSRWNNNCNVFLNYIWAFILKAHIRKVYENAVEKKQNLLFNFLIYLQNLLHYFFLIFKLNRIPKISLYTVYKNTTTKLKRF